jgi:hypothetical protein
LREADGVEVLQQLVDALADGLCVVGPQGRAVLADGVGQEGGRVLMVVFLVMDAPILNELIDSQK